MSELTLQQAPHQPGHFQLYSYTATNTTTSVCTAQPWARVINSCRHGDTLLQRNGYHSHLTMASYRKALCSTGVLNWSVHSHPTMPVQKESLASMWKPLSAGVVSSITLTAITTKP